MAGHPTIGSTFALAHTGVIAPGAPRFVFGLDVGPTPVDLEWEDGRLRFAWMTQRIPTFGPRRSTPRRRRRGARARAEADLLPRSAGAGGVVRRAVPVRAAARSRDAVDRAVSDAAAFRRLRRVHRPRSADLPVRDVGPGAAETVYSRMFAPEFGIVEDPATGSASGPLGCYLVRHGLRRRPTPPRAIVSLQGVAMGRPSRIHIAIDGARRRDHAGQGRRRGRARRRAGKSGRDDFVLAHQQAVRPAGPVRRRLLPAQSRRKSRPGRPERRPARPRCSG